MLTTLIADIKNIAKEVKQSQLSCLPLLKIDKDYLLEVCRYLFHKKHLRFGGIIAEQDDTRRLYYLFYLNKDQKALMLEIEDEVSPRPIPSISTVIHGADWIEREIEDLFGIGFRGHPRLGDFVIHNESWGKTIKPMRKEFDVKQPLYKKAGIGPDFWKPIRIVEGQGVFAMPIGPIYSGPSEAVHFMLETVGEEIIRAKTRLFYKYRAVEKLAEGRSVSDVILLAERFSGTSAFSHALGFSLAVENALGIKCPKHILLLRTLICELERLRHHIARIEGICNSTGLCVATSQAGILHEELLRISCEFSGHRYLFGLANIGGLLKDISYDSCSLLAQKCTSLQKRIKRLEGMLRFSSSFLDRLEEVGIINPEQARQLCLVGPVGRACGQDFDLRRDIPYLCYDELNFECALEVEGDGYARLRVFFKEAKESIKIIKQVVDLLNNSRLDGKIDFNIENFKEKLSKKPVGISLVEAPSGAALHWVRLDQKGNIERYRIITPAFFNWHAFHLSTEGFAFQDFPIILASFGLSVAENDR